jgi:hypothetical protein
MTRHPKTPTQSTPAQDADLPTRGLEILLAGLVTLVGCLVMAASVHAGPYVIDNCPSAPIPNGNAGPWQEFGAVSANKSTCADATGEFIGPLGGEMAPASSSGVIVSAPAGITISAVSVYWYEPQSIEDAHTYAEAWSNSTLVGEAFGPVDHTYTPDNYTLPAGATNFSLHTSCSSDDGVQGCVIGKGSETPDLQMFGSQITLEDNTPPAATVTGGILAGTGTLTGTQGLSYTASDPLSGVRQVKLLIDGVQAAANTYTSQCPYQDFLACPANITDTIDWNTASVTDGQHSLQVLAEDAAQNTTVFYHATITTNNAPTLISPPLLTAPTQLHPADSLSIQPGNWSAPPGAGAITYSYQWQDCDTQANNCQAIPGAQTDTYTPTANDIGHTLRALVTAADNDGSNTQTSVSTSVVTAAAQAVPTSNTPQAAGETQASNPSSTVMQAGTANGTSASQTAILKLYGAHAIYEPYTHRAFKITGQLLNNQEQPIAGATLDVLQQTSDSDTVTLLQHATTRPNGTFTTPIPPGPSRRIEIAYPRIHQHARLHDDEQRDRDRRGWRAHQHHPRTYRLDRHDHSKGHRLRADPPTRSTRSSTRLLARQLADHPHAPHQQAWRIPYRIPVQRRHRTVPLSGGNTPRTSRLPLHGWPQQHHQGHDHLRASIPYFDARPADALPRVRRE